MFCLVSFTGSAQAPDTIFANENHNIAIFFPEKIRQGIVGAQNYIFSYNEEHPQYFGLLKASPGPSSNLLVLTGNGGIYSYIVCHKNELPQLTYFLGEEESLGNEIRKKEMAFEEPKAVNVIREKEIDSIAHKERYLESLSSYYLYTSTGKLKKKHRKGIGLQVNELIHYRDEVFIVFELKNTSGISFEPEYLRLYASRGNKRRNASYQKLLKEPVFRHRFPEIVEDQQRKRFVYVFPKFTIGEGERMEIELREKKGNRFLRMQVKI